MLSSYMLIVRSILACVFSQAKLVVSMRKDRDGRATYCIVQTTIIAVRDWGALPALSKRKKLGS